MREEERGRKEGRTEERQLTKEEREEKYKNDFIKVFEGMKQQHMVASMVTSICIKFYGGYETWPY